MKKILIMPDSFKGTMSSAEVCALMKAAAERSFPDIQTLCFPIADGGEGSVDCFLQAAGGHRVSAVVSGPYGDRIESFFGLLDGGETAVVEMAAAAGLPLVGEDKRAEQTTTYGVGELILAACRQRGVRKVIVGLGGSATNDGGCGAAAACGVRFFDAKGAVFVPVGATLQDIVRIDASGIAPEVAGTQIFTMCDIDNPLCGPQGAAAVFGPQKGAALETVAMLDSGLRHLSEVIERDFGERVANLPGAGAAGGMGAGMVAFFGSQLQMGITTVLDVIGFPSIAKDADLILTGEGRIDGQSLHGKAVIGIARAAKKQEVPVVVVAGDICGGAERSYAEGVTAIFSTNRLAVPFSQAKATAREDMELTLENLMRLIRVAADIKDIQN